jgi:hypothetical protein
MGSSSVHVAAVLISLIMLSDSRAATSRDIPADASIALRCSGHRVLIIGETADDGAVAKLTNGGFSRFPQLQIDAEFSPGEVTLQITTKTFHSLMQKHVPGFVVGARWQVYPGAGPPATVVIEKLVLLWHGNGSQHLGALGRILNPDVANRIAGLRAAAYLAFPGLVVPGISEIPLKRVDQSSFDVTKLLLDRGRELVRDDNWKTEGFNDAEALKRLREMNRTFLTMDESHTPEIRMWRWAPDKRKSLLLVEVVWISEDRKLPLFAVDAVVQEQETPAILSFDCTKAEWMRGGEGSDRDWRLHAEDGAFLNAWKVGTEFYVLTYIAGYEGYSVDLQRVDPTKGLVTVLTFGQ